MDALQLTAQDYAVIIGVFYASYIALEIPTNLLITKVGASRWIPVSITAWSIATICHAAVSEYSHLVLTRFFLGAAESGIAAGLTVYLTTFYKREEMMRRMMILQCSSLFGNAFGGLIAYAIQRNLEGAAGLSSWRWIFILEGGASLVFGSVTFFTFPSKPDTAIFLCLEHRRLAAKRIIASDSLSRTDVKLKLLHIKAAILDYKTWVFAILITLHAVINLAITYYLPTIIRDLGTFEPIYSNLMTVPPHIFAILMAVIVSMSSERLTERGLHTILPRVVSFFAYVGLLVKDWDPKMQYTAVFFLNAGNFSSQIPLITWFSNAFAGHYKKATSIAIIDAVASMSGIISGYIYSAGPPYSNFTLQAFDDMCGLTPPPSSTFPKMELGISAVLCGVYILLAAGLKWVLIQENQRRDNQILSEEQRSLEGNSELGDAHPSYRYIH
ncbi:uncharacterized protein VTP21DRAFT_9081 [Calcarisporiella thermophila]|uniref:uncharacterized protein n=1 Tax=Calcarisporiella thermophila TaxID=911321 RepID=UPI003742FA41